MGIFNFNLETCVKCGACSDVCMSKAVVMNADGPKAAHEICIGCGHCVAVCPTASIDNVNAPLKGQKQGLPKLYPDTESAAEFLRQRRSIRSYSDRPVPREEIAKILDVARFALTAGNSQAIFYLVIDAPPVLAKIKEAVILLWEKIVSEGRAESIVEKSGPYPALTRMMIERYRKNGEDTVLWNAPSLVLAVADRDKSINPRESAIFSLMYAHLYAPTLKLGSCWAGAVENTVFAQWQPMIEALKPYVCAENIAGALMVGYPKYKFRRLVDRNPLTINWI